jgi:hypothetical protein
MKYTPVFLAAILSMAAAVPVGEMDHTRMFLPFDPYLVFHDP